MSVKEIFDIIFKERLGEFNGVLATVNSVDPLTKTCEVTDFKKGGTITNVRLFASYLNTDLTQSKGLYVIPSVGSKVIVHQISDQDYYVSMFSQIDEVDFFDGSLGGMTKVITLTTKLNNLENKVNSIINTFNAHVHSGVTTGGGTSAITPTLVSGTLTPTNQVEIENAKIKNGT